MNPCIQPEPQIDIVGDKRWMSMHNRYIAETKVSESEILFIGDSIIQGLYFSSLWQERISSLHCINFGIGGDRTQHILWRMQNGELNFNTNLKAIILFVGTNNIEDEPENIFEGILECAKFIRNKQENAHIIIPTLLPRGQYPNKLRDKNLRVNLMLTDYFDEKNNTVERKNISVIPIHENIVQMDGTISHYTMYDYLHLTDNGYTKIWTPVYEKLCDVIRN